MNRRVLPFAVLVWAVLVGCGGTETLPQEERVGTLSEALVTCTATCRYGPSVSCTGTTCSATQGSQVTCDGVTTRCAPRPCSVAVSCEDRNGAACAPRDDAECCNPDGSVGFCLCRPTGWYCPSAP
jgi:hypothetical protein